MTRKDYELIADAVSGAAITRNLKAVIAVALADALAADNPRFDRARFLRRAAR